MITTGYCLRKLQEHVLFVNHPEGNVRFQLDHIQFFCVAYIITGKNGCQLKN